MEKGRGESNTKNKTKKQAGKRIWSNFKWEIRNQMSKFLEQISSRSREKWSAEKPNWYTGVINA